MNRRHPIVVALLAALALVFVPLAVAAPVCGTYDESAAVIAAGPALRVDILDPALAADRHGALRPGSAAAIPPAAILFGILRIWPFRRVSRPLTSRPCTPR